jgi:hypothetical protein
MNLELLVPAAFLAGLFGSAHCLGMCGAIVILFEGQAPSADGQRLRRLLYNTGRLSFYMLLGAIAGLGGALITQLAGIGTGLAILRILAGLLVIALGCNLLFDWHILSWLERSGAILWKRVSPLARHVLPVNTPERAMLAGFLWGALPCGLVYSAVSIAGTSGSAAGGALVMLAFWLGTLPALLLAGESSAKLAAWRRRGPVRKVAGTVLLAMGLLALAFPFLHAMTAGHDPRHELQQTGAGHTSVTIVRHGLTKTR